MLRSVRVTGEMRAAVYHLGPISTQTATKHVAHPPVNAPSASPYDPAYAQSKVSKRRRGKEIQAMLNSSVTKAEDNWISWNNPPPQDRFNVTLHADTDAYRVYDWVAERTSMLQVDSAASAKKVADDYLTQRRIDFCTGTLNSEKTFQSARNRIMWSLHQQRFYWYLGMPSVPGHQWDVERGDTRDQLVIIDKRKVEDLPGGERSYRIAYSTLINQGFDEVMWAHGCILEYTRILMGAMIGTPYPSESRSKDVNESIDSRSAARWSIAQPTPAYWRVTDRYLNASYQLSRTDATNPGFRISSWVANEISTCYHQRCDMMSEYGERVFS